MNPEQLEHYRKRLEEQLASLGKAAELHQRQLGESQTTRDFVGGDRAADLENQEVDSSVAESELRLVEKIEHALDRIDKGTYGTCEGCGEEIPAPRLEAKPSVSLCISCQEKHEAGGG